MNKLLIAINIVLAVFVVIIFALLLKAKKQPAEETSKISISSDNTVVYVNNDSINEKYSFMLDTKKNLEEMEKQMRSQYEAKARQFQNEYESYLKKGASLSLAEQKKTEAMLQEKQKNIMQLDQELSSKFTDETQKMNTVIHDTVTAFLKRFNRNKNYTYIFGYTPGLVILYANEKLDITKKVLTGLNEEYKKWKIKN
ncbi:MAG: OmpH family outer membrane protein [Bacteroidales bacterium]|jgi:outer membrane protein